MKIILQFFVINSKDENFFARLSLTIVEEMKKQELAVLKLTGKTKNQNKYFSLFTDTRQNARTNYRIGSSKSSKGKCFICLPHLQDTQAILVVDNHQRTLSIENKASGNATVQLKKADGEKFHSLDAQKVELSLNDEILLTNVVEQKEGGHKYKKYTLLVYSMKNTSSKSRPISNNNSPSGSASRSAARRSRSNSPSTPVISRSSPSPIPRFIATSPGGRAPPVRNESVPVANSDYSRPAHRPRKAKKVPELRKRDEYVSVSDVDSRPAHPPAAAKDGRLEHIIPSSPGALLSGETSPQPQPKKRRLFVTSPNESEENFDNDHFPTSPEDRTPISSPDTSEIPSQKSQRANSPPRTRKRKFNYNPFFKKTSRSDRPVDRQIQELQKSTDYIISKSRFRRLVTEIIESNGAAKFRYQPLALEALQVVSEALLVNLFEDANLLALHAKRVGVQEKDINLALRLNPQYWMLSE